MTGGLDLLVVGSGVAGLSAAVRAATAGMSVGVVSKAELDLATTRWAQGGVASARADDAADVDAHLADTLRAGGGLCDVDAVRVLVDDGPARVAELIGLGASFDLTPEGVYDLAREGGHSVARVLHAGGAATGAEIERALVDALADTGAKVWERTFVDDLVVEGGRCRGVRLRDDAASGGTAELAAAHVLLAAGGAGQLFAITTNPEVATGDGVAMALRAGVAVADLEFFQFHPTALAHPSMPRPLLSEALRGHGAVLRDAAGRRFVDELEPRDVVARAITATMAADGTDHVWLDASGLDDFAGRFPTIAAELDRVGLDPGRDLLPVAPAAHHQCGGVVTDLDGATTLPGLWAAGEVACTGVHGANRLASNSLLEGMVFAARVVEAIAAGTSGPTPTGAMRAVLGGDDGTDAIGGVRVAAPLVPVLAASGGEGPEAPAEVRRRLQRAMTLDAGVLRSAESLARAAKVLEDCGAALAGRGDLAAAEVGNLVAVGRALLAVAAERTESRGTHSRVDHPDTDPAQRHRLVIR